MRPLGALFVCVLACGPAGSDSHSGDSDTDADSDADTDSDVVPADPLEGIGEPQLLATDFLFTEGPLWLEDEQALLFTDIPANVIYRWSEADGVSVFRDPSGNANGLGLDPDGLLLACEHGNRRVTRTTAEGDIVPVAEDYEGQSLNSPNDVIARADGVLWFTDPTYGIPYGQEQELSFQGLFRLDDEGLHVEADDFEQPNGVVLTPDQQVLYVSDSQAGEVRRYEVLDEGLGAGGFWVATGGGGDGMAIDADGNLYVTRGSPSLGVWVLKPDGTEWGAIPLPETPTNVSFGGEAGRTLFITAQHSVYTVELQVAGLP